MIGKVLRGERVAGLIYYLYGPGRHEEHTDPHIVAGWRHPAELEPPLRPGGRRDFRPLNGLLQQTLAALGDRASNRPVWHCVARAAPTDRMLSDDEWAQVAAEIMHRTGLAPTGEDDDAVRWVAIRHADDHIHIVATLARQDGTRPRVSNDYYRVREACLAMERRFGLRPTAPGDRTAAHRPTRAENEKARRRGWPEPPRVTIKHAVSTAAATAWSEAEFFDLLQQAGLLVRKRFSTRDPGEVTGYAVALPHNTTHAAEPVWYSGGKLAADLTLPKLRHRWSGEPTGSPSTPTSPLTGADRAAIWEHAARAAANAAAEIRCLTAAGDHAGASDAAWAAGDALHAAASALGSRMVREAASVYDRAARTPYGRIPRRTRAGAGLRRAARLMSAAGYAGHEHALIRAAMVPRLAALTEAVAELRLAQRHGAQAAAARAAADQLRADTLTSTDGIIQRIAQRRANGVAREAFPGPAQPTLRSQPGRQSAHRPPTHRPGPPKQWRSSR
ncbi:MAG TPA: hypothetical protein VGS19_37295 [Streptosporangiaceae bacterium]|nr:hypothetical protein [Streptosporangiaceae bacterium]